MINIDKPPAGQRSAPQETQSAETKEEEVHIIAYVAGMMQVELTEKMYLCTNLSYGCREDHARKYHGLDDKFIETRIP